MTHIAKRLITMKTKKNTLIAIVVLLLATALFYWFQWRPSSIRKSCAEEATSKYRGYGSSMANNYYRLCLVKHQMKPESLFVK